MDKGVILIVDDEPTNLKLLSKTLQGLYRIRIAITGEEALERVLIEPIPSLILLDVMMPGMDGYTVCKKLKANSMTSKIPVIFISAKSEIDDEAMGFDVGAVDYINKPISPSLLMARVKSHITLAFRQAAYERIISERTHELKETQEAAILMLGEAGHYNDTDTGMHVWRMAAYSQALAQELDWSIEESQMLKLAATLHDTGKIALPDSILKAPRKLTPEEWINMKEHTSIGYSILSKSTTPFFKLASEVALYHHEKWDGTGYPKGLKGIEIPFSARIVAVADVFDALTTVRPYKDKWSLSDAFTEIENSSGSFFDPSITEVFLSIREKIIEIKMYFDNKDVSDLIKYIS